MRYITEIVHSEHQSVHMQFYYLIFILKFQIQEELTGGKREMVISVSPHHNYTLFNYDPDITGPIQRSTCAMNSTFKSKLLKYSLLCIMLLQLQLPSYNFLFIYSHLHPIFIGCDHNRVMELRQLISRRCDRTEEPMDSVPDENPSANANSPGKTRARESCCVV